MAVDCKDLSSDSLCQKLSSCTQRLRGQESDSTSPSDVWFITIEGRDYFVKLYHIIPSPAPPFLAHLLKTRAESLGLRYEKKVYEAIVAPLLAASVTKAFIKYIGSSDSCSFETLVSVVRRTLAVPRYEAEDRVLRNVLSMINPDLFIRESISSPFSASSFVPPSSQLWRYLSHSARFGYIMTERVPKAAIDLTTLQHDKRVSISELLSVIFQVLVACYALSLSKTCHNDLHTGNIFVVKRPRRTLISVIVNHRAYNFWSLYSPKIYDFDRSYSTFVGNNPYLDPSVPTCDSFSQCNRFIENIDMVKFLGYLHQCGKHTHPNAPPLAPLVLFLLAKDMRSETLRDIKTLFTRSCHLQSSSLKSVDPIVFPTLFKTSRQIVEGLGNIVHSSLSTGAIEAAVNECDFTKSGRLKVEKGNQEIKHVGKPFPMSAEELVAELGKRMRV